MKRQKAFSVVALLLCLTMIISIIGTTKFTAKAEGSTLIEYSGHQQNVGDLGRVADGATIGVTGKSLRLEAITLYKGSELSGLSGDIECQAHVQNIGDTAWIPSGSLVGTSGRSLRVEAIRLRLTGQIAEQYDVYYSLHIQNLGWTGWVQGIENTEEVGGWCGSRGMSLRIEAMQIKLVPAGEAKPDSSSSYSYYSTSDSGKITYSGHVQNIGDIPAVSDGQSLGTTGRSLRIEALRINLTDAVKTSEDDGIQYRAHVQNIGWQDWVSDGEMAGTAGQSLRVEAIQIALTGDIADKYDVWYRVHAQNFGWMGWAKNGASAGSEGFSRRLEAIEIRLIPKGLGAPGSTTRPFSEKKYTGKLVALTFDDGPGPRTNELLDCLEKYDAHATFYVVGSNARLRSNLLSRMERIGCEVGNHTNSHAILSRLSASGIKSELEGVDSTLRSVLGHNAVTMRPPGGGHNATVRATVDTPIIMWSIDTLDWKTRNTQQTISAVLDRVQDGDIILMHDIHSPTIDAALYLIPELKRRGYTLVTVSELAEAKGVNLEAGEVYNSIR